MHPAASGHAGDAGLLQPTREPDRAQGVHPPLVRVPTSARHPAWMPTEGQSELRRFEDVDPTLFEGSKCVRSERVTDTTSRKRRDFRELEMRGGDLNPFGIQLSA